MAEPVKFPKEAEACILPNQGVIKLLEDTLALAKEGKVQAVGVACVYRDSVVPAGETYSTWAMGRHTKFGLTHAILMLQTAWAEACHRESS